MTTEPTSTDYKPQDPKLSHFFQWEMPSQVPGDWTPSEGRCRLDRWLTEQLNLESQRVSRSFIQELIAADGVQVNGKRPRPSALLRPGDRIEVRFSSQPEDVGANRASQLKPKAIPLNILFEDDHIIVINKPQGLTVHPGAGTAHQATLIEGILAHVGRPMEDEFRGITAAPEPKLAANASQLMESLRPGVVHRLDRNTSGVMVVAKTRLAHHNLAQQFKDKATIRRDYIALLDGLIEAPVTHESWLSRDPSYRTRFRSTPTEEAGSRWSQSFFKPMATYAHRICLAQVTLKTGRTHQIRLHASDLGAPVVGDTLYGKRSPSRLVLPKNTASSLSLQDFEVMVQGLSANVPGQFLHAYQLGFDHPKSGNPLLFMAEYPKEFKSLVEALKPFRTS